MTVLWAPEYVRYEQQPFKRIMQPLERSVEEGAGIVTAYRDGTVTLRSKRRMTGYTEAADLSSYRGVCRGDLVVHGLDILAGAVGVSDSDGAMSAVCTVCQPLNGADPRFVAYVIRSQAHHGFTQSMARGIRQRSADFRRWETLADLPIPCPPPDVQRRVADFLDAETVRVDTLITAQGSALALMDERQAALTYHHIKSEPARNTPICYLARYVNGFPFKPEDKGDEGLPIVRIAQLLDPEADVDRYSGTPNDYCHINSGDLIFSWSATLAARIWNRGPAYLNQHLFKVLPAPGVDRDWLRYALEAAVHDLDPYMHGSTMTHITRPMMGAVGVPLPSLKRQREIARTISSQRDELARLRTAATRQVELLRERRQALITAAVTGQLDI